MFVIKKSKLNIKCLFIGLYAILLFPNYSFSQHYNFKNVSINEGLQSSFVYAMQEDNQGFIWFATEKGVSRYDGITFEYFGEKNGLTESGFYQILIDKNNVIWLVSKNFKVFYFSNNKFFQLNFNEKVCWIDIDKNNKKWFLTRNGGLYFLNAKSNIVKHYSFPIDSSVFYSFKNIGNNNFIVSNDVNAFILKENLQPQKINIPVSVLKNNIITRFFQKQDRSLLISNANGVFSLKNNKLALIFPLKDNQVYSFYEDIQTKDIWLATLKGAYFFKNGLINEKNQQVFLKNNIILGVYKIKEGNIWICTSENGVFNVNTQSVVFDETDGLQKNAVSYIKKDKNDIYTISYDRSMSIINNKKIIDFNPFASNSFKLTGPSVSCAVQTINDGVFVLTSDIFQIKNRKTKKLSITGNIRLTHLFKQNDLSNLYVFNDSGCLKGTENTKKLFDAAPIFDVLKKNNALFWPVFFKETNSNYLFYHISPDGLIEFFVSKSRNTYKKINFPYKIQDVWMTANKSLIIGTLDKGLCILKNNKQKFYAVEDGLLSNYCTKTYYINNRIWICSNKGVSRLELDKNDSLIAVSNFTSNDLLVYNEANDLLIHKGDVYVATNKGVSVFPENIKLSTIKPNVFIENVLINNKQQSVLNEYNLLYNENNISIHYKTISFRSANNIIYKYKLTSKNDSIIETTKLDRIQLGALSPGTYNFSVWARNIDGVWSQEPAVITFNIEFPLWKKWWFLLTLYVLFAILVFIVTRSRLKAFKEKNDTEKRIIAAELKAIRLHMNPHFIYNTLSSLQYYIIYNKNKEASKYLSTFSLLLRLIMNHAKQNEIYLYEELDLLEKYIELEQMRFDQKIDFELEVNKELLSCLIPPLILQPFVENAIKYGIANIKGKGKLEIRIVKENNFLVCTIQDNGIGRAQSELLKDDENIKFESTGINYTRERLRLLSNKKNSENLIVITDLYENNLSKGTLIKINIPI
ncbi:MAG: histidine kinase [Bacteroidia bacterium]|nr:histidine kinase [Bacteroidia bacterium]